MKRLSKIALLTLTATSLLFSCNGNSSISTSKEPTISFIEGKENVWLDRYEEIDVPLNEIKDNLTYEIGDENVVKVISNRLYAQGVGETVVKISDGDTTLELNVRVRDSGVKPAISFREFEAYLDIDTALPQQVSYNGKLMDTTIEYSVDIKDPSIVSFSNNKFKGLALGTTKFDIKANWKGIELKRRDISLTIKERLYISASSDEIELYNTTSKLGHYDLDAIAYDCGVKVDKPVTYKIISGNEFIRLEGNRVYAVKEGKAVIEASFKEGNSTVTKTFNIKVGPNYVTSDWFNPQEVNNTLMPSSDPIGNRKDVYFYKPDPKVSDATCFKSHVVDATNGSKLVDLYREGKRYFAYDLYWSSNENMMVGTSSATSWIGVGDYFRKDYLTILKNGEVTNVLEKDTWVTMVYDLKALWLKDMGLASYFFFFINDVNGYAYLTKPKYYLDDSFIPSENRIYTKKDGYIQATNDEFDIQVPVSKGYSKHTSTPSIVVNPNEVPTYKQAETTVGNRSTAYQYKTFTSSNTKNKLVVATSMNESYDDSLYNLSKKGSYFAFDIYPTKESILNFNINGDSPDYNASIVVNETNLSSFGSWLIAFKDGKRLNQLEANTWQTIVYAYSDSYIEDSYSGSMGFASSTSGDKIYIDNCRYYEDSSFIPTEFAPEKIRIDANNESTKVTRLNEGEFAGAYEITSSKVASLAFSETNVNGEFFKKNYRYIKFDLRLENNVSNVSFNVTSTSGLKPFNASIEVGKEVPSNINAIDENGLNAKKLEKETWYTFYIPLLKDNSSLVNPNVTMEINGTSGVKAEFRYLSFVYDVHAFYLRGDQAVASDMASLVYETSGEFEGTYTYKNASSGEYSGEGQNWGEAGVYFDTLNARDCSSSGNFFKNGYYYMSLGIYFESSVKSFSFRATGDKNFSSYWLQDMKIGGEIPDQLAFIDENGNRVHRLEENKWYTMVVKFEYTSTDNGWTCITLYTNGSSRSNPSVIHLRDLSFSKEYELPEFEIMDIKARSKYGSKVTVDKLSDGSYRYINKTSGELAGEDQNWGESGVYFNNVTNENAMNGNEVCGDFFKQGYHYIKVDIKLENCTHFSIKVLGQVGLETYWPRDIGFDTTLDESLLIYKEDGSKATTLSKNTWYTLYIPVLYTEGYSNWTDILIYTNGGSSSSPSIMYLKNVSFLKERVGF